MLTMNNRSAISKLKLAPKSFLITMDLFKKLPAAILADVEKHLVERKYAKNDSIFQEGDAAEHVWFVKEGHVKAVHHAPNGRCQTLCMTGTKGMFGSCCSFGQGQYPCNSMAETNATVFSLPMSEFNALVARYPEMGIALVQILSERLRSSKDTQTFDQEPVEARILHVLLNLVKEFGKTIPLTRRDIAEMASTTVETSIRTFLNLEEEGLVSTSRRKIIIKDVRLLNDRLEQR